METVDTASWSPREVIISYLGFFKDRSGDFERLRPLLSDRVRYVSPLGQFFSADSYIEDLARDALLINDLKVKKLIVDGQTACALYDVSSRDPEIGTISVTEWFEIFDGRIESITSTHDASAVKAILNRI